MSDNAAVESDQAEGVAEPQEGDVDQVKTFDSEYVAKLRKENARYRQDSKKLAELEDAQKSDAEKAADRIAKAEAEAASVPSKVADSLKAHLVELHSIDAEDAELFLTATDPELLLKQVTRLLDRSDKRRVKHVVAREGENPSAAGGSMRELARQVFNGNQ
jgi:hypothetical protein